MNVGLYECRNCSTGFFGGTMVQYGLRRDLAKPGEALGCSLKEGHYKILYFYRLA